MGHTILLCNQLKRSKKKKIYFYIFHLVQQFLFQEFSTLKTRKKKRLTNINYWNFIVLRRVDDECDQAYLEPTQTTRTYFFIIKKIEFYQISTFTNNVTNITTTINELLQDEDDVFENDGDNQTKKRQIRSSWLRWLNKIILFIFTLLWIRISENSNFTVQGFWSIR